MALHFPEIPGFRQSPRAKSEACEKPPNRTVEVGLNGLDPEAYIAAVLDRLAGGHPISRIDELLPWNFKANCQPA